MDMAARFQDQAVFHLTGKRAGTELGAVDANTLRPALLSQYGDLARLRYDYPVVLADGSDGTVASLTDVINRLLAEVAPRGIEGELLRRHVLRLERELRRLVARGATAPLSELWQQAADRVGAETGDTAHEVLARAAVALKSEGQLADCDEHIASRLLSHLWTGVQTTKAARFRQQVRHIVRSLSDILRAAYIHSEAGQQPAALRAAVGNLHADEFDFDAMSKLVARGTPKDQLPAQRRGRIEWALKILRDQPFYPDEPSGTPALTFSFDNCAAAAAAYRERLPKMVEFVKAMAVGELEAVGNYLEGEHDTFFDSYDEGALTPDDLALFPDYLVCIAPERNNEAENASLLAMLSSGLPVKVLVQVTDLVEDAAAGTGQFAFGVRSARLATTAMALGGLFVLQSSTSNLYALRERVRHGLEARGAALYIVYAGVPGAELPRYLAAAAAMDARAFPAFTYDAQAGANWAARFSLENNRDPEADWPHDSIEYADDAMQRAVEPVAFTFADFVLCDPRYAKHFAVVPRERWSTAMVPVADWLALTEHDATGRVPYLWAADRDNKLHRVIVDAPLMRAARRALLLWHRLQEHGGVHNSHAEQLLARERATWEADKQKELAGLQAPAVEPAAAAPPAGAQEGEAASAPAETVAARSPDEAWIDTLRCPSCNECQNINDRMFAYNDNKQAYIKDLTAGTYRQMVEAAEACQVAIIHPGKPLNPNEPGLDELLERARPFL
jgi:ferredoxin